VIRSCLEGQGRSCQVGASHQAYRTARAGILVRRPRETGGSLDVTAERAQTPGPRGRGYDFERASQTGKVLSLGRG
jgi:hypothetical protein